MGDKELSIHAGHRERMRKRYYETGLKGFQPHEIIELILYGVIPKKDVNPLAHTMLRQFGSLRGVFSAPQEEMLAMSGVGPRTVALLDAMKDILNLYSETRLSGSRTICNVEQAVAAVRHVAHKSYMQEIIVLLENNYGQLMSGRVFLNNLKDPLAVREILEAALSVHAHSVIIALKGFGPQRKPNRSEIADMSNLVLALQRINVYTLEVLILSGDHVYSLRDTQLLTDPEGSHSIGMISWMYWLLPLKKYQGKNDWYYIPADRTPDWPEF